MSVFYNQQVFPFLKFDRNEKNKKMKKLLLTALLAINISSIGQEAERPIGVNLPTLSYASTTFMMADLKKQSSGWFIQDTDEENWNLTSINMPSQPNGYPLEVPFEVDGQTYQPHCILISAQNAPFYYPAGNYTVVIEGQGTVQFEWDTEAIFEGPGTYNLPVIAPSDAGMHLKILSSDPTDPIRNIAVYFPEHGPEDTFNRDFLNLISPFEAIRFIKATSTEENPIVDWEDRTLIDHHTYQTDYDDTLVVLPGTPWEHVIALCNDTQKDAWINIPYLASDAYVEELATLFFENLDPELSLYLEYSNETWNFNYGHTHEHVNNTGMALGFSDEPYVAGVEYTTYRSLQIFEIFEDVYGASMETRVEKVLASAPWNYPAQITVNALSDPTVNPNGTMPDALSMAPYIGGEVIQLPEGYTDLCHLTTADIIDSLEINMDFWMHDMVDTYRHLADSLGIEMYSYEGGQHLAEAGFWPTEDPCAEELIISANRHPDMESIYCEYYDYWYDTLRGDLHMTFMLAGGYSEFGAFGLLESQWQTPSTSPKWNAHVNCELFLSNPEYELETIDYGLYPNPTTGRLYTSTALNPAANVEIYTITGQPVSFIRESQMLEILNPQPGYYFIVITQNDQQFVEKVIVQP